MDERRTRKTENGQIGEKKQTRGKRRQDERENKSEDDLLSL